MTAAKRPTPAKQTPMASAPPVRDEAAELAAQLAATQESGASAAAPGAEICGAPTSPIEELADHCVRPAGHDGPHADDVGNEWSEATCGLLNSDDSASDSCSLPRDHDGAHRGVHGTEWSSTLPAIEGEIVNDLAPICQQAGHFPGGWKALRPDAASAVCSHGTWTR